MLFCHNNNSDDDDEFKTTNHNCQRLASIFDHLMVVCTLILGTRGRNN